MNRHTHDLLATVGEYKDNLTGETKKRRVKVGVLFTDDQTGVQSLKLETIPVGPAWSGFISIFPKDNGNRPPYSRPPEDGGGSASAPTPPPAAGTPAPPPPSVPAGIDDGDEIPF